VQTAKIGDYINSTCVFDALCSDGGELDVLIDKTNESLARYDERIKYVYLVNNFRKSLFRKAKLAHLLFARRYCEVIILLPNQFNLFLGAFCTPNYNATIRTYNFGISSKILSLSYHRLIRHERDQLTLDSYSKCIKHYDGNSYRKSLKLRHFGSCEIQNEKNLKIAGVTLSSGAEWKNLPIDEWQWVFSQLVQNNFLIAVIGIGDDEDKLKQILTQRDFRIMNLINKVFLEQLPELISRFSLFVSSAYLGLRWALSHA
jgi:ADP-heptose:LPS heptosyltransferase